MTTESSFERVLFPKGNSLTKPSTSGRERHETVVDSLGGVESNLKENRERKAAPRSSRTTASNTAAASTKQTLSCLSAQPRTQLEKIQPIDEYTDDIVTGDVLASLSNLSLNGNQQQQPKKGRSKGVKRPQKGNYISGLMDFFWGNGNSEKSKEKAIPQPTMSQGLSAFLQSEELKPAKQHQEPKTIPSKKTESAGLGDMFLSNTDVCSRPTKNKTLMKGKITKNTCALNSVSVLSNELESSSKHREKLSNGVKMDNLVADPPDTHQDFRSVSKTPQKSERATRVKKTTWFPMDSLVGNDVSSSLKQSHRTQSMSTPPSAEKLDHGSKNPQDDRVGGILSETDSMAVSSDMLLNIVNSPANMDVVFDSKHPLPRLSEIPVFSPEVQAAAKRRNMQPTPTSIHLKVPSPLLDESMHSPVNAVSEEKSPSSPCPSVPVIVQSNGEDNISQKESPIRENVRPRRSRTQPNRFIDYQAKEMTIAENFRKKGATEGRPIKTSAAEAGKRQRVVPDRFGNYAAENQAQQYEEDDGKTGEPGSPDKFSGTNSVNIDSSDEDEFDPVELARLQREQAELDRKKTSNEAKDRHIKERTKSRKTSFLGPTRKNNTSRTEVSTSDELGTDGWTQAQVLKLNEAHGKANPTSDNFWSDVATMVPGGKTAVDCSLKWFSMSATPAAAKERRNTAYMSPDDDDDVFMSTPMRDLNSCQVPETGFKRLLGSFGSAIKVDRPQSNEEESSEDEPFNFQAPKQKTGYKTYLTEMRRAVNREKSRKKKPDPQFKETKRFNEYIAENGIEIGATLSPGGTFRVATETDDLGCDYMSDTSSV